MTHKPPLPDAATAPWPATPAPHEATLAAADPAGEEQTGRSGVDKRIVAGVAGIAVGSAAIAAALLFAGRLNRPKSASAPARSPLVHEDAPEEITPARRGDARYIDIE